MILTFTGHLVDTRHSAKCYTRFGRKPRLYGNVEKTENQDDGFIDKIMQMDRLFWGGSGGGVCVCVAAPISVLRSCSQQCSGKRAVPGIEPGPLAAKLMLSQLRYCLGYRPIHSTEKKKRNDRVLLGCWCL